MGLSSETLEQIDTALGTIAERSFMVESFCGGDLHGFHCLNGSVEVAKLSFQSPLSSLPLGRVYSSSSSEISDWQ